MADQLRRDAVGAYWPEGRSPVRTPNLDRIAREGARFERCYTASPICMPARASVLTGRWPHAHGLWDNGVRLPPDTTTLATVLAQRGYRTAVVGKGTRRAPPSGVAGLLRRRLGHAGGDRAGGQGRLARAISASRRRS